MPERYGPWKTVYSLFCKWQDDGTLKAIFHALHVEIDAEHIMIDLPLSKPTNIA
ncbi:hypothetical protein [Domibacillus indicus]|uniref:hypothetical protein n=1 Tax=Domibacillus indicus TaxID=1437523 RepID=UPI0038B24CB0